MYACTFIGHRNCPGCIRKKLYSEIDCLITKKEVNTFYVGTEGAFDKLVYKTLCELEKKHKIKINVVLAYLNRKNEDNYYDIGKTVFPDCMTKTPLRFAINKRNLYMLGKVEYLICFLDTPFSNTFSFVEKAKKKKIKIINLGSFPLEEIQ